MVRLVIEGHQVAQLRPTGAVVQQLHSPKPIDSIKWNPKHLMLAFNGDYARDREGLTSLWVAG